MLTSEFKFKLQGQKVRARVMADDEVIHGKCMKHFIPGSIYGHDCKDNVDYLKAMSWIPVNCIGEKVGEFPSYVFIEILSPFWKGME